MSFSFDFGTPDPNAPPPDATQPAAAPALPPPPKPETKPAVKAKPPPETPPGSIYVGPVAAPDEAAPAAAKPPPDTPPGSVYVGPATPKGSDVSTGEDVARGAGGGLTAGTTGLVSGPLAAGSWLQKKAIVPAAKALGFETDPDPGGMLARGAANVEQAGAAATKGTYFDPTYQPQTTLGEIAKTTAEFAPGAFIPGGGEMGVGGKILRRVLMPAAGTELGGAAAPTFGLDPATGRVIGGLGGAAATMAMPSTTRELAQSAETLDTSLPGGAAGGPGAQLAARNLQKIPIVGAPITAMGERAMGQATAKVGDVLETAGATTPDIAGQVYKTAVDDWKTGELLPSNKTAYDAVTAATGNAPNPLDNARQVAGDILGKRADAKIGASPAVNDITQALQDPRGMSFDAMKTLRTQIGAKISPSVTPVSTDAAEYKQIYDGLTQDMGNAAAKSGATDLWDTAETQYKGGLDRQKAVATLIAGDGNAAPEKVIQGIQNLAGSKAGADIGTLNRATSMIGQPAMERIAASVAQKMGDDGTGNLSLAKLSKSYNALSNAGKDALYPPGSTMRTTLDAIDPVVKSLQGMGAGLSKTTHAVSGGAVGITAGITGHLMSDPILALKTGGMALAPSLLLAAPATGSSFAKYLSAYRAATLAGKLGTGTLAASRALQGATRNLANTINSQYGENVDPDKVTTALQNSPGQQ